MTDEPTPPTQIRSPFSARALSPSQLDVLDGIITVALAQHDPTSFVYALAHLTANPAIVATFAAAWADRAASQTHPTASGLLPPASPPPQPATSPAQSEADPIASIADIDAEIKRLKLSIPSGITKDQPSAQADAIAARIKDLYALRGKLASQLGPNH